MLRYQTFDPIFGFKLQNKAQRCGRDVLVCPICDTADISMVDISHEDDKHLTVEFKCSHKHRFRLELTSGSRHVKGEWGVLADDSVPLDELPTTRQLELAERISQRLGIPNPWSEVRCLFPDLTGENGMPLFMSCGIDRKAASNWISQYVDEYRDHRKKTSAADIFAVWRLENPDGTITIGISDINDGVPSGADIWTGPGFCERGASDDDIQSGKAVMGITDEVLVPNLQEIWLRDRALFGCWHRFPFVKGMSKPPKAHRQYPYSRARKTAQACAIYERELGRVLTNEIPDDLGPLQYDTLVLFRDISDSGSTSIADLAHDSRARAVETKSELGAKH